MVKKNELKNRKTTVELNERKKVTGIGDEDKDHHD